MKSKYSTWVWCIVGVIVGLACCAVQQENERKAFEAKLKRPQPTYFNLPEPPPEPVRIDVTIRPDDGGIPQLSR